MRNFLSFFASLAINGLLIGLMLMLFNNPSKLQVSNLGDEILSWQWADESPIEQEKQEQPSVDEPEEVPPLPPEEPEPQESDIDQPLAQETIERKPKCSPLPDAKEEDIIKFNPDPDCPPEALLELEKQRLEIERQQQLEQERLERERQEQLKQERLERERQKRLEQERLERERQKRLEQERLERERQKRLEQERLERERQKRLEQERARQAQQNRSTGHKQSSQSSGAPANVFDNLNYAGTGHSGPGGSGSGQGTGAGSPDGAPGGTSNRNSSGKATGTSSNALSSYTGGLRAAIDRNKRYPRRAQRMGIQGIATVSFTVQPNGTINNVRLSRSSGNGSLDSAATEAVSRTGRYKPTPNGQTLPIAIPINFNLR